MFIWLMLQMIEKDTYGIYQLYFYVNLFHLLENSSTIDEKALNKSIITKLLNKVLLIGKQDTENKVETFAEESDIERVS